MVIDLLQVSATFMTSSFSLWELFVCFEMFITGTGLALQQKSVKTKQTVVLQSQCSHYSSESTVEKCLAAPFIIPVKREKYTLACFYFFKAIQMNLGSSKTRLQHWCSCKITTCSSQKWTRIQTQIVVQGLNNTYSLHTVSQDKCTVVADGAYVTKKVQKIFKKSELRWFCHSWLLTHNATLLWCTVIHSGVAMCSANDAHDRAARMQLHFKNQGS